MYNNYKTTIFTRKSSSKRKYYENPAALLLTCPTCDRPNVYLRLIRIPKKTVIYKTVKTWDENLNPTTEPISLERRYHPYKYESLLSFFGSYKIPDNRTIVINPPPTQKKEDLSDSQKEYWDVFVEGFKKLILALAVAPDAIKKYPSIPITGEEISSMFEVLLKTFDTVIDDRWDRSMIEWMQIIQTAQNKSPSSASRKYSAVTRDGREIRLSPRRIKQMMDNSEISKLVNETQNTLSRASPMAVIIMAFVNGDPELLLKYKALERYWDKYLDRKLAADQKSDSQNMNYIYFETRYHDSELYEMQKLDWQRGKRKSKPDWWKTCCRFRPDQLPADLAQHLQERAEMKY